MRPQADWLGLTSRPKTVSLRMWGAVRPIRPTIEIAGVDDRDCRPLRCGEADRGRRFAFLDSFLELHCSLRQTVQAPQIFGLTSWLSWLIACMGRDGGRRTPGGQQSEPAGLGRPKKPSPHNRQYIYPNVASFLCLMMSADKKKGWVRDKGLTVSRTLLRVGHTTKPQYGVGIETLGVQLAQGFWAWAWFGPVFRKPAPRPANINGHVATRALPRADDLP
jgi:hypothetical protein